MYYTIIICGPLVGKTNFQEDIIISIKYALQIYRVLLLKCFSKMINVFYNYSLTTKVESYLLKLEIYSKTRTCFIITIHVVFNRYQKQAFLG